MLLVLVGSWIDNSECLVVVPGLHEGRYPFSDHFKTGYFLSLSVQKLTLLEELGPEPLPNKTEQSPVPQPPEKRMRCKRLMMYIVGHSTPKRKR